MGRRLAVTSTSRRSKIGSGGAARAAGQPGRGRHDIGAGALSASALWAWQKAAAPGTVQRLKVNCCRRSVFGSTAILGERQARGTHRVDPAAPAPSTGRTVSSSIVPDDALDPKVLFCHGVGPIRPTSGPSRLVIRRPADRGRRAGGPEIRPIGACGTRSVAINAIGVAGRAAGPAPEHGRNHHPRRVVRAELGWWYRFPVAPAGAVGLVQLWVIRPAKCRLTVRYLYGRSSL
jgi:hypothetical protein